MENFHVFQMQDGLWAWMQVVTDEQGRIRSCIQLHQGFASEQDAVSEMDNFFFAQAMVEWGTD